MQPDKKMKHLLDILRPVPDRDLKMAASSRANFLEHARTLRLSVNRDLEGRPNERINPISPVFRRKIRRPVLNTLIAVVLAVFIFFGGTAITVYAAQDSLPGGTLYPIKTLSEDTLLSLTASPQRQLDLTLDFSDRRVAEMVALQSAGKPISPNVVDRLQNELDFAMELVADMNDADMAQTLEQVLFRYETEMQTITKLVAGNPANPVFMLVRAQLQEQVRLAAVGKDNPQDFRIQVREYPHNVPDVPNNSQHESTPEKPERTPMPGGNGNGSGGENHKPTNTPRQRTPSPKGPKKTPQSGSGSDHGL